MIVLLLRECSVIADLVVGTASRLSIPESHTYINVIHKQQEHMPQLSLSHVLSIVTVVSILHRSEYMLVVVSPLLGCQKVSIRLMRSSSLW